MNSKFFVTSSSGTTTTSGTITNSTSQQPQGGQKSKSTFFSGTSPGALSNGLHHLINGGHPGLAPNPQLILDAYSAPLLINPSVQSTNGGPHFSATPTAFTMATMNQTQAGHAAASGIAHLLKDGHKCIAIMDAVISLGELVQSTRRLALVQYGNTFGFFIWITNSNSHLLMNGHATDPSVIAQLDRILPIDSRFKFEIIESNEGNQLLQSVGGGASDICLKVSYDESRIHRSDIEQNNSSLLGGDFLTQAELELSIYNFNLSYNKNTSDFISHLHYAIESLSHTKPAPESYAWLLAYQPPQDSLLVDLQESVLPDVFVQSLKSSHPSRMSSSNQFDDNFCPPVEQARTNLKDQMVFDEGHFIAPLMPLERQQQPPLSRGVSPISSHWYDDSDDHSLGNENTREAMIHAMTEEREAEYTSQRKYRIFIGTWNVNGKLSQEEKEMRIHFLSQDKEAPDFYAIGFQELDLSKEAYLFDNFQKEEYWRRLCQDSLHPDKQYHLLKLERLIGMMLIIFVNKELLPHITNLQSAHVGTGILGKMGNKGGVAVRFDLHDTSLCFVNCHLAAHVEQYERRNQDYKEINSRLQFVQKYPYLRIADHDQIYWFGDLNYRVMNLSTDEIKYMCEKGQYSQILEHDQLKKQKAAKNCFVDYAEGPITHLPTYKYNTGTDEWDSSEKRRPPAWCDRILWKGLNIHQTVYRSHPRLKASDHKPVSALFDSNFRVVDQRAKRKVYEDVMKRLDKQENDYLPQVEIDTNDVYFGTVRYKDSPSRTISLKNVGQTRIRYEFVSKPNDTSYCKDWLRITPASAFIARGETAEIRLELCFDSVNIGTRLNYGLDKLSDTLVLRLRGGKDIFITVHGEYRPSCFGCSLETLTSLNCPISEVTVEQLKERFGKQIERLMDPVKCKQDEIQKRKESNLSLLLELDSNPPVTQSNNDLQSRPPCPIPKELFALMDYLFKNDFFFKPDLFQTSASESDFVRIRESLDRANPALMKGVSVDSVAEAMLLLLQCLPEPVIPCRFYDKLLANRNNISNCRQIINELPEINRRVFEYLVLFLRELAKYTSKNRLDARIIAKIFGPILVRKYHAESSDTPNDLMGEPASAAPPQPPPRGQTAKNKSSQPSSEGRSQFYSGGLQTTASGTSLASSASSGSLSSAISAHSDLGQVTPEQTFIYMFLSNGLEQ